MKRLALPARITEGLSVGEASALRAHVRSLRAQNDRLREELAAARRERQQLLVELHEERQNSTRFHAQLLAERVRRLPTRWEQENARILILEDGKLA